jgi:hypothetical protein
MDDQELATLDRLLDSNSPRTILESLGNLMERRAASVLDVENPTTDDAVRMPALLFRASSREIRSFSLRV